MIINSEPTTTQGQNGSRESESDRRIEQTITFMREHLNQSLPVAKLASLANMSPSYYTALFKRHTGCAPIDYFIRLRMRHARDLLMTTSLNVKEVAAALGYEDPFYFSRVFKSVNQVAPSDYRVMHKEESVNAVRFDDFCIGRTEANSTASITAGNFARP
jgi:transcriptional regulator GlxA family with amidase domain